jgi:hypothetical protein
MFAYKELDAKTDEVLKKSREASALYQGLLQKSLVISSEDMVRIERIIPKNFDPLSYFIQIDKLAFNNRLIIRSFTIPQAKNKGDSKENSPKILVSKEGFVFECIGAYADIVSFLTDIERTLALTDIEKLSISVSLNEKKEKVYIASFSLHTYAI